MMRCSNKNIIYFARLKSQLVSYAIIIVRFTGACTFLCLLLSYCTYHPTLTRKRHAWRVVSTETHAFVVVACACSIFAEAGRM